VSCKSFYRHFFHIPGEQYFIYLFIFIIIINPCMIDKLSRYNQINAQYQ